MAKSHIFQIINDEASRDTVDSEFSALDNTRSDRADWLEYAPILQFLRTTTLAPGELYGFVTERFHPESGVTPREMTEFVSLVGDSYDVVNFMPFPDQHALFWNVFEQGEYQRPGHAALAQDVLRAIGVDVDIPDLVMDSRNSIFRTYFAAKPAFWREWLALAEKLVALADAPGALHDRLNASAPRRSDIPDLMLGQAKVAVMERLASVVLSRHPELKAVSYRPFQRPCTRSPFAEFPFEAVLSDALKIAYNVRGDAIYKSAFGQIREQVQKAMQAKRQG